jgi:hypothetical protein
MDTRYLLHTLVDGSVQSTPNYESHKTKNEKYGRSIINGVFVYTPELAIIFELDDIPARDMNKRDMVIDTRPYFDEYVSAFHDGQRYFDANFVPSPNIVYGSGGRQYMVDLHAKYFHDGHTGWRGEGWNYVKRAYPIILTFKTIREFGYYSGIIHQADAMIEIYPVVFRDFHKHGVFCNHSTVTAFETIFRNPNDAERIKQLLILYDYADENGGWIGRPSKLALVVDVLCARRILRNECDRMTAIRAFFDEFGLKIGPGGTSIKTLEKKRSAGTNEFTELFSLLS